MTDNFTDSDREFMQIAIDRAVEALESDNFPCGAVLVVDGEVIDSSQNFKETRQDRYSHAEMLLYIQNSQYLKKAKKQSKQVTMYTSLEPCLMCFGAACLHRVDYIMAATPDPFGNMSKVEGFSLGDFYKHLPQIKYGLLAKESVNVITSYLSVKGDKESLEYAAMFRNLQRV